MKPENFNPSHRNILSFLSLIKNSSQKMENIGNKIKCSFVFFVNYKPN